MGEISTTDVNEAIGFLKNNTSVFAPFLVFESIQAILAANFIEQISALVKTMPTSGAIISGLAFITLLLLLNLFVIGTTIDLILTNNRSLQESARSTAAKYPTLLGATTLFSAIGLIFTILLIALIGSSMSATLQTGTFDALMATFMSSVLIGLVLAIPMAYLSLRLSLFPYAAMTDSQGAADSLKKSWTLTDGKIGSLLIVIFYILIILVMIQLPISILAAVFKMVLPTTAGQMLITIIGNVIRTVIPLTAMAFVYQKLK